VAIMEWDNPVCTFQTLNTVNNEGNSWYFVFADKVNRYAPINNIRDPQDVRSEKSSICYLHGTSVLYHAIAQKHHHHSGDIHLVEVIGKFIKFRVDNYPANGQSITGFCCCQPANGMRTFDFDNFQGDIDNLHHGHAIINLTNRINENEYRRIFQEGDDSEDDQD